MRLARRVGLVAVFLGGLYGSAAAGPEPEPGPRIVCPPAAGPITVDGDLREWTLGRAVGIGPDQLVRKSPTYGGPADLSGRILICRSATTLYVAGEIKDDTVYWNPEVPWRGDCVELFIDFRQDETPRPTDAYDEATYQLLLQPLAPEVRWSFASFRGRGGRHDDPVDGVELAGMRFQDERGATVGYRFELALPLANFPEAPRLRGASFGFDVALSDSDGLPEQRNYATWSGRAELARYPSRFGRLVLGEDPPQVTAPEERRGASVLPIAFLSVLLALVLAIWLWRGLDEPASRVAGWLLRLGRIPVRSKLIALGTLLLLLIAAGPITSLALRALASRELAGRRELARTVREIGAETNKIGLNLPQPPVHPAPLLSLLSGQSVRPPTEFDFTVLPPLVAGEGGVAALEPPARTLGGVPFYRRDIPAASAWSPSFLVHPPLAASAVTFVTSWQPDPRSEKSPRNGDVVAEARVAHQDGTVDPPVEFVWGRHVDACDDLRAGRNRDHGGAPEAKVAVLAEGGEAAPGAAATVLHADEVRAAVPLLDSPIVRIEVEQRVQGGRFTIHGITLHPKDAAAPVPLPLGRITTTSGIPTAASPFPAPGAGLLLSKAAPRAEVACDALADRIWIVVSLRGGYDDRRFGLPVLLVRPEFEDGSADGPFPLEVGNDIDPETSQARQHVAEYRSELAFEWGLPAQPLQHADLWTAPLARTGRRLTKIHFEFKGGDEVVRVSSIILGAPGRGPSLREIVHVESTSEGYRLSPALVERLSGLGFTLFRDGAVQATTFGGADRERHLARTVTADAAATVARTPEGVHDVRIVDGRRLHTLAIPLPAARTGIFLEMSWTGDAEDSLEIAVFRIRSVLGILLAPLVVLLAADAIARLRTVHARLVAVCAAVSAVPAVLGFFAIGEMVGGRIEEAETGAVLEKAAAVKSRLTSYRTEALRRAEAALRDESLREALKRRGSPDFRASVGAALRDLERSLAAGTVPGARLSLDDQPLFAGGVRSVFPSDAEFTVFSDPATQVADALAYRWSRLTVRGVAKVFDSEGRWQTTVVVDLPVDRTALAVAAAAAGGDVQVQLYTPRGFPLAETAARTPGEELPEATAQKVDLAQKVLEAKAPLVAVRPLGGTLHTVAYDVLRGESGELSLLATALPRTAADALIERVGHTSLLIFGAGVVAQFLIVGLVAVATSRPLRRVVERAAAEGEAPATDEVAALSGAWTGIQSERDNYRAELTRLSGAAAEIARARDPDAVVSAALDLLRRSAAPWGGMVLTVDEEGRVEVAGGFRGSEPVARIPLVVDEHSPLRAALRGRGDAIVPVLGAVADTLSRDERGLFEGAASLEAFPLADEEERGGALVLLDRPGTPAPAPLAVPATPASPDAAPPPPAATVPLARRAHAEFLRALARQVGLALGAARLVRLAVRDAETGTHVAAWFAERLREEVDRAVAAKRPIALLLVAATVPPASLPDVRAAAQRLADRLRAAAPQRAFVGRREPLEFGVAIPEADRAAAEAVAQVLRKALAEAPLADLRIRIGLAACPEDAGSSEFLLAEAERRLRAEPEPSSARAALAPDQGDRLAGEARRFGFVAASPESRALLETVHRIAASDLTILVEGETGAGKELVADLLHRWSPRRDKPLIKLNCAALPDALLESELFGYERGAFTGADRAKPGRFELADGGTLVLDEIGELPLALQAKLLRVLEDRRIEHLGGTRPIAVDVRVVASTNRDLGRMVAEARFREDLFYRLNAVTIAVPPLRARKEDIPPLAEAFLRAASEAHGRRPPTLQPDAMDLLFRHTWPGNVRELRNLMEQTAVLQPADTVRAADLLPSLGKGARLRAAGSPGGAAEASRDAARAAAAADAWGASRDGASGIDSPSAVSDRQRRLLALLAERTWITTSEYCEVVGVSPRTALRDVRELVERGVILMEGRRRGARYRLP